MQIIFDAKNDLERVTVFELNKKIYQSFSYAYDGAVDIYQNDILVMKNDSLLKQELRF